MMLMKIMSHQMKVLTAITNYLIEIIEYAKYLGMNLPDDN